MGPGRVAGGGSRRARMAAFSHSTGSPTAPSSPSACWCWGSSSSCSSSARWSPAFTSVSVSPSVTASQWEGSLSARHCLLGEGAHARPRSLGTLVPSPSRAQRQKGLGAQQGHHSCPAWRTVFPGERRSPAVHATDLPMPQGTVRGPRGPPPPRRCLCPPSPPHLLPPPAVPSTLRRSRVLGRAVLLGLTSKS